MGAVYLAEDPRLGRRVAIKVLPPELAAERERLERFEQEARAVAALNHPNIVTLFSVEEAPADAGGAELRFLTMEWVEGETLGRLLGGGGLVLERFFDLAVPLVDAVAAAHAAGIVHRDLKPANVMVGREGRVKVLDFGIAKLAASDADETALTRDGMMLGTFRYMAPEQAVGGAVGPAADVFALGILLHEMLAGERPFGGESGAAAVSSILRDEPAPLAVRRPGLPAELYAIVGRCLAKEPAARYPTAAALGEALAAARRAFERARLAGEAAASGAAAAAELPTEHAAAAAAPADRRPVVVVAGFRNLGGDAAADWLSTGITETVTVDLKKLAGLRVVSRDKLLRELGGEAAAGAEALDERRLLAAGSRLGVDWIVSGAFQKLGEAIRITARFVDVAAGELIESVKLDGEMGEIFGLQDRIVQSLAATLELEAPEPAAAGPADTDELAAYECCARGLELVGRMDSASLEEARGLFARAIELDPGYALAHAGLGRLHAMRFIGTTDLQDLETSVGHLERATELDPELGEPWVWLAYDRIRLEQMEEALAAGERAVALEPDSPLAHYMLGIANFLAPVPSWRSERQAAAVRHLGAAARLAPRYQPAWQLLGAVLLRAGDYAAARPPIEHAAEIEASGRWELSQFVGAHTLLGRLHHRRGAPEAARAAHRRSLELLAESRHFYVPMATAASLCGLADLEAAAERPDRALSGYRRARELAEGEPRALGVGWLVVRARLGMAAMFRRLLMRREESAALEAALELLGSRQGFDFSALWDDGAAELHYELARHRMRRGEREAALAELGLALDHGWGDRRWLERDELLAPLAGEPAWERCLAALAGRTRS